MRKIRETKTLSYITLYNLLLQNKVALLGITWRRTKRVHLHRVLTVLSDGGVRALYSNHGTEYRLSCWANVGDGPRQIGDTLRGMRAYDKRARSVKFVKDGSGRILWRRK